jgi:hypothetical protein
VFTLKGIDPSAITMIQMNAGQFNTQVIGGQDFEILPDASQELFADVRADNLAAFVAAHPDWVSGAAPAPPRPAPSRPAG